MAAIDTTSELLPEVEHRRRARIVAVAIPGFLGLLVILSANLVGRYFSIVFGFEFASEVLGVAGLAMVVMSGAAAVMWYLQTGFKPNAEADLVARRARAEADRSQAELKTALSIANERRVIYDAELARLQGQLSVLAERLEQKDKLDTAPVVAALLERARAEASSQFLHELEGQLRQRLRANEISEDVSGVFTDNSSRLQTEIQALSRRGNLNLILGGITTVSGLVLLAMFVLQDRSTSAEPLQFALHFVPRVTLVVFIQIFAYFFLKLYKNSLSEMKYFQNELTNIEQRQIALLTASQLEDDKQTLSRVVEAIARTDRNPPVAAGAQVLSEGDKTLIQTMGEAVKSAASALPAKSG